MTQQGGIGGEACLDQEAPPFVLGHPEFPSDGITRPYSTVAAIILVLLG